MSALSGAEVVRAAVIIAALVGGEAFVFLHVFGLGDEPLRVYDYQVYDQLAVNLLERFRFSPATSAPYEESYFRTPGYPAFIALVYAIVGRSLIAVRTVQFVLLAAGSLILFVLFRRFADPRPALIGALLSALYPPLAIISAAYVAETLSFFIAVVVVLQVVTLKQSRRPRLACLVLGVSTGILALVRPAFTLAVLLLSLMTWAAQPLSTRIERFVALALLWIGFAAVMGPWLGRNWIRCAAVTGPSPSGWALFVSAQQWTGEISYRLLRPEWDVIIADFNQRNAEAAKAIRDDLVPPPSGSSALARQELHVHRLYSRDALRKAQNITLGNVLYGLPARVYWLWSTGNTSQWATGAFHRALQVWHVLLTFLILTGCYLARRTLRSTAVLWILPLYLTLLHMVFHVEARYTFPARPFLFIYAAFAIDYLMRRVWSSGSGTRSRPWSIVPDTAAANTDRIRELESKQ